MKIASKYHIEKVCKKVDTPKPGTQVYFENIFVGINYVYVTNGYILVRVPALIQEKEQLKVIPVEAFSAVRKATKKSDILDVPVSEKAHKVLMKRFGDSTPPDKFLATANNLIKESRKNTVPFRRMCIDSSLLALIGTAFGDMKIKIKMSKEHTGIYVYPIPDVWTMQNKPDSFEAKFTPCAIIAPLYDNEKTQSVEIFPNAK